MLRLKYTDLAKKFEVDPQTVRRWFEKRGKVIEDMDDVVDFVVYMRHK